MKEALKAKQRGNIMGMKRFLAKVKNYESSLNSKRQSLLDLEKCLLSIHSMHEQASTLDAMQVANKAMNGLRHEKGLTVERVEEVMENLNDEMDEINTISQVLANPNSSLSRTEDNEEEAFTIEVKELEEELNNLMRSDEIIINKAETDSPTPTEFMKLSNINSDMKRFDTTKSSSSSLSSSFSVPSPPPQTSSVFQDHDFPNVPSHHVPPPRPQTNVREKVEGLQKEEMIPSM
mmetsp:Transcript_18498/g.21921  ORF Transcript_18498/g.21921 Transcript_18498/m.21921 type:complete len:234 (+) Transcript_18498:309-1010(+)